MTQLGSQDLPLRVAVVGAGPAGFYAAELLLKEDISAQVDLFEALPSPYGLVRYGVAPDHPKMRTVIARFDRTGDDPNFNYFGNIRLGTDIDLATLREYYDAVIITTGAQEPKALGIPGEDLAGCYTARPFIRWYNAYPDHSESEFDLSCATAVVIGNGNVALDIARVLSQAPDELAKTDMATRAIDKLRTSKVRTVYVIGRRGLVQASFTHPEITELDKIEHCDIALDPSYLQLDAADRAELEFEDNVQQRRFLPNFEKFSQCTNQAPRRVEFRFLRSPVAIEGDGRVERIVLRKNILSGDAGARKAIATEDLETINCGLVFSCVGYRGEPLPGIPYDDARGTLPNDKGRVLQDGKQVTGLYVSGWIKRGPSGVIGTNKVDSKETIESLVADLATLSPAPRRDSAALRAALQARGARPITYQDWLKINKVEAERGRAAGKPLERFTSVAEMLAVL
ncbi:MAG: FAD-dependent oxidoreductase [Gammaproteobacteria bacterium]|nr:FAD-dependent oxidoreductase [Gammaproteobacteria bacterium]